MLNFVVVITFSCRCKKFSFARPFIQLWGQGNAQSSDLGYALTTFWNLILGKFSSSNVEVTSVWHYFPYTEGKKDESFISKGQYVIGIWKF